MTDGDNLERLLAGLDWLDGVLRRAVATLRAARTEVPQGGLYISDAEVDRLLHAPREGFAGGRGAESEAGDPGGSRLDRLAAAFGLSEFERTTVLLCLAPEIDRKYERIYAWIQDDVQATQPTAGLALALFAGGFAEQLAARSVFEDPSAALNRGILAASESSSLLARPLRLDSRIAAFLLGSDALPATLRRPVPIAEWMGRAASAPVWSEIRNRQLRALEAVPARDADWLCLLSGAAGSGKKTFAREASRRRGLPLLAGDLGAAGENMDGALSAIFREAALYGVPVYLEGPVEAFAAARHHIEGWPGLLFLATSSRWHNPDLPQRPVMEIEFGVPEENVRRDLWLRHAPAETASRLAGLFRFLPGQSASPPPPAAHALSRGEDDPGEAGLMAACRSVSSQNLVAFAMKVPVRRGWDDLVLPKPVLDQLREVCTQVRFRSRVYDDWGFQTKAGLGCGLLVLFSGASGTGKTMAAEVIAGALGLDLFKIDLATLVSKYIGETEKNLARVFEDGERSGGILFFDEADAVFGKRTEVRDAHDRYANLEISYLLQRIEDYPGVVILASNLGRNIDAAFQRRMNFAVEFPFPDADHRRRIWESVFPASAPLAAGVDFGFLAERFALCGGHIRNIAVSAAFHAASNGGSIGMHHLLLGLKREYQKMGKVCDRAEFGDYYHLVR